MYCKSFCERDAMPGDEVGVLSDQLGPLIFTPGVHILEYKETRYFQFIYYFLI